MIFAAAWWEKSVCGTINILNFCEYSKKNVEKTSLEMRIFWQEELVETIQLFLCEKLNFSFARKCEQIQNICCCMAEKSVCGTINIATFGNMRGKSWKNFLEMRIFSQEELLACIQLFWRENLNFSFAKKCRQIHYICCCMVKKSVYGTINNPIFGNTRDKNSLKKVSRDAHVLPRATSFFNVFPWICQKIGDVDSSTNTFFLPCSNKYHGSIDISWRKSSSSFHTEKAEWFQQVLPVKICASLEKFFQRFSLNIRKICGCC